MSSRLSKLLPLLLVALVAGGAGGGIESLTSSPAPQRYGSVINPTPSAIGALAKAENLKDLASAPTALENLGTISASGVALGKEATLAAESVDIGVRAGAANTTGKQNVIQGADAGEAEKEVTNLVATGYKACQKTTAPHTTCVGSNSLAKDTTGEYNAMFGASSGFEDETGERNTGDGYECLLKNKAGNKNTCEGYAALNEATKPEEDTATGALADGGVGATEPLKNTADGYKSCAVNSGSSNVCIGVGAGEKYTGNGGVFIGFKACEKSETEAEILCIGDNNSTTPLIQGSFTSKTLTVNGAATVTGILKPGTSAANPTTPTAESEVTTGGESAGRKLSFAVEGNGTTKGYKFKTSFETKLIQVSVQEESGGAPGKLVAPSLYEVVPVTVKEVEVKWTVAISAKAIEYVTIFG
jgi:hypothetical protein